MTRINACNVFLSSIFLALAGCTDITEYDVLVEASIIVYDSDLQIVRQADGFREARSILTVPGYVLILTSEGRILKLDSQSLEIVETVLIGESGATGYSTFAESPTEGTIYVIGPLSTIYEIKLATLEVLDTFNACLSPSCIASSNTYPSYTFIGDGSTNSVLIYRSSTNNYIDTWISPSGGINAIATSHSDTTLIATEYGVSAIIMDQLFGIQYLFPSEELIDDFVYFPWYDLYVCCNNLGEVFTMYWFYDPLTPDSPTLVSSNDLELSGLSFMLDCDQDRYAWILSYQGEGVSRLYRFDPVLEAVESTDVAGAPIDLTCSGSGLVYVLSMEVQ